MEEIKWNITAVLLSMFHQQVKKKMTKNKTTTNKQQQNSSVGILECFQTELMMTFIFSQKTQDLCFSIHAMRLFPSCIFLCALFLAKQLALRVADMQIWNFTFPLCKPFHLAMKLCNPFVKISQLLKNWNRWARWLCAKWEESQLFLIPKLFYVFGHPCCPFLNLFQICYILFERNAYIWVTANNVQGMGETWFCMGA